MKKNRLLWALLLMVAPLLCTSCSSEEETRESQTVEEQETAEAATTGTAIHYEAVVSDGNSTRASVDGDKKYIFQADDKLYVTGTGLSGVLTLKEGAGASTATFEGDLVYDSEDAPADDLELSAVLVSSADKLHTVVDGQITATAYPTTAITSTLTEAVERYSQFTATSAYGSKSFTLYQQSTFLNFVITLEDATTSGTSLTIDIKNGGSSIRTGSVATAEVDGKVVAQFVTAMPKGTVMDGATVQLGTWGVIPFGGTTTLAANKIYNIKKTAGPADAINGQFSVRASQKVYFSKGNLQATTSNLGSTWTWSFAEHQWDYVGDAVANTKINGDGTVSENGTVDLFGWSTSVTHLGINNSSTSGTYSGDFADWGSASEVTSCIGTGWRTLTSEEWTYVFNTRTTTSGVNYAKATVNGKAGVILLPDDWNASYFSLNNTNTANAAFDTNTIPEPDWTSKLEVHGAVFLPAAGGRYPTVSNVNSVGRYWSATANDTGTAYNVGFKVDELGPANSSYRYSGYSVRLVRNAE